MITFWKWIYCWELRQVVSQWRICSSEFYCTAGGQDEILQQQQQQKNHQICTLVYIHSFVQYIELILIMRLFVLGLKLFLPSVQCGNVQKQGDSYITCSWSLHHVLLCGLTTVCLWCDCKLKCLLCRLTAVCLWYDRDTQVFVVQANNRVFVMWL